MPQDDNTWQGRIIFGLASTVIIGLLLWGGNSLVGIKEQNATLIANQSTQAVSIADLKSDVQALQGRFDAATANRYTSSDATQYNTAIMAQIAKVEDRITQIASRVTTIEARGVQPVLDALDKLSNRVLELEKRP